MDLHGIAHPVLAALNADIVDDSIVAVLSKVVRIGRRVVEARTVVDTTSVTTNVVRISGSRRRRRRWVVRARPSESCSNDYSSEHGKQQCAHVVRSEWTEQEKCGLLGTVLKRINRLNCFKPFYAVY